MEQEVRRSAAARSHEAGQHWNARSRHLRSARPRRNGDRVSFSRRYDALLSDLRFGNSARDEMADDVRFTAAVSDYKPPTYHDHLNDLGLLPVVGAPANVANAVGYAKEGDWGNAALSALAILPFGALSKAARPLLRGAEAAAEDALRYGDDAARALSHAGDVHVYTALDESGKTIYVGITNNIERRAAEHARTSGIIIHEIPNLGGLSRVTARGVEQSLIDYYKLSKNGGSLINKINSIADTNPQFKPLTDLGQQLLEAAGYSVP